LLRTLGRLIGGYAGIFHRQRVLICVGTAEDAEDAEDSND
jgi:hypothetical protein